MEFNARYALTGLFTLVVAFSMLVFVYWLSNSAGFGEQTQYRIRYPVPVSGLNSGSDVLFNGIKVGEVTGLGIDGANPGGVLATISVMNETPIRTDSVIGIDFQGLTGAASVLIVGGAPDAPGLETVVGEIPVIDADPAQSRSWTQKAGSILGSLEDLLDRNSGRLDTILTGLERLAGGNTSEDKQIHNLEAADAFVSEIGPVSWQLVVGEPTVLLSLNTDRILQQIDKTTWQPFGESRWADNLPNLFQSKTIQSFENAGLIDAIMRPADAFEPDFRLIIDLRMFHYSSYPTPEVLIDFVAKISDRDGNVIASRHFQDHARVDSSAEPEVVGAMNTLFSVTMERLVRWASEALTQ